jgi:hypothetical protein
MSSGNSSVVFDHDRTRAKSSVKGRAAEPKDLRPTFVPSFTSEHLSSEASAAATNT